jgi:hypothetical protein
MTRCANCFRYSLGQPTFCNHCGRSFDVRICTRGHVNPRGAQFCAECGSGDLSTPAPPAGFLFYLSQWVLRIVVVTTVVLIALSAVLGLLAALDWSAIGPRLLLLVLMVGFLYWTTTLLPGPIRKLGKHAGKAAWHAMKTKGKANSRRRHE